jgi:hypothetical protein
MSRSRDLKPLVANLEQPAKSNESANGMVLARIFAQSQARKSWLVRHKLVFGLFLGGLAAVLSVAALLWTLSRSDGNSLKVTSRDEKSRSSSDRETANLRADSGALRGERSSNADPVMTTQAAAVVTADGAEPRDKANLPTARSSADESRRVTFGPISFVPPENWEKGKTDPNDRSALLVLLAPSESRWRQLGFGPILTVDRGPDPRMSLESLKDARERVLQGSVEKVNEHVKQDPFLSETDIALAKKPELSQVIRNIDGSPVLASTCYSLIEDRSHAHLIKTRLYTVIRSAGMYMVGLAYPVEAEEEMDRVCQVLEGTIRIVK